MQAGTGTTYSSFPPLWIPASRSQTRGPLDWGTAASLWHAIMASSYGMLMYASVQDKHGTADDGPQKHVMSTCAAAGQDVPCSTPRPHTRDAPSCSPSCWSPSMAHSLAHRCQRTLPSKTAAPLHTASLLSTSPCSTSTLRSPPQPLLSIPALHAPPQPPPQQPPPPPPPPNLTPAPACSATSCP